MIFKSGYIFRDTECHTKKSDHDVRKTLGSIFPGWNEVMNRNKLAQNLSVRTVKEAEKHCCSPSRFTNTYLECYVFDAIAMQSLMVAHGLGDIAMRVVG